MPRKCFAWAIGMSLAAFVALCPAPVTASSHSEAPGTTKDRLADDTDLYAWVATGQETVLGTGRVAPYFVGPTSMPDYAALAQSAIQTLPGGYKVFVGPRDDPFFVDLAAVFDLLSIRRPPGDRGKGVDGVAGFNVMSVVMQVPKEKLTKDGTAPDPTRSNNIIGIWDTAERQQTRTINGDGTIGFSGPEVQVSRLGMPLVNEIVIPLGKKDLFNATEPSTDVTNFGAYVVDPEPARLLHAIFGINV